jgi:MoxR-like ATPase
MEQGSLYSLARQVERTIAAIVSGTDIYALEAKPRELAVSLKRQAADARLDVRDYEHAETRREQLQYGRASRERFEVLHRNILAVSEYSIFTTVDVVQLSAWIDSLLQRLE